MQLERSMLSIRLGHRGTPLETAPHQTAGVTTLRQILESTPQSRSTQARSTRARPMLAPTTVDPHAAQDARRAKCAQQESASRAKLASREPSGLAAPARARMSTVNSMFVVPAVACLAAPSVLPTGVPERSARSSRVSRSSARSSRAAATTARSRAVRWQDVERRVSIVVSLRARELGTWGALPSVPRASRVEIERCARLYSRPVLTINFVATTAAFPRRSSATAMGIARAASTRLSPVARLLAAEKESEAARVFAQCVRP